MLGVFDIKFKLWIRLGPFRKDPKEYDRFFYIDGFNKGRTVGGLVCGIGCWFIGLSVWGWKGC